MAIQERQALLILGMHRSGTSALTRVLSLRGAALPRAVMAANAFNVSGYWEPVAVVSLHDRLLAEAGSSWDDPQAFPADWFESTRGAAYVDELVAIITAEYGAAPLLVMKDPRTSRLMPLWRRALARLAIEPAVVIVSRHPLEVAASLQRREGMPDSHAFLLWLEHVLAAEAGSRDLPRVVVTYDQLLDDWGAVCDRIAAELHVSLAPRTPDIDAEVGSFLNRTLRSTALSLDALEAPAVPEAVRVVYRWCQAASIGAAPAVEPLDRIREELHAIGREYLPSITWSAARASRFETQAADLKVVVTNLRVEMADLEEGNRQLTEQRRELEARVVQLEAQALEGAASRAALQADLDATRRARAELEAARNALASRLAAIDATWIGRLQRRLARVD